MDVTGLSQRIHRATLPSIIVLVTGMLLFPYLHRGYEALLLLLDIGMPQQLPTYYSHQQIRRQGVRFDADGQSVPADIYRPPSGAKGAIILQHGAAEAGKSDARLIRFAEQLCRAGFLVMVPEMPGAKALRVSSRDLPVLRQAVAYLRHNGLLDKGTKIGIGGFSIAAGLAIHAAMLPELRQQIAFVLAIGGYHDLPQTLHYMTTGHFFVGDETHYLPANEYGKWVFVLSNIDKVSPPPQQELLRRIALAKYRDDMLSTELVSQLKGEALAIYQYIDNPHLEQAASLMQRLPAPLRDEIARLDLADKALSQLLARVILVHGRDDTIIPYAQSVALQQALPAGQAQLFLLDHWAHVDPTDSGLDGWQIYRALYHLLELRDG